MRGEVPPGPEICKPLSLPEIPDDPNQGKSAAGVSNDVAIADRAVMSIKRASRIQEGVLFLASQGTPRVGRSVWALE